MPPPRAFIPANGGADMWVRYAGPLCGSARHSGHGRRGVAAGTASTPGNMAIVSTTRRCSSETWRGCSSHYDACIRRRMHTRKASPQGETREARATQSSQKRATVLAPRSSKSVNSGPPRVARGGCSRTEAACITPRGRLRHATPAAPRPAPTAPQGPRTAVSRASIPSARPPPAVTAGHGRDTSPGRSRGRHLPQCRAA